MDFSLINVALHYGAGRRGVELGPEVLHSYLEEAMNRNGHKIREVVEIREGAAATPGDTFMKWTEEIAEVTGRVREASMDAIRRGLVPLVIGGDHSLGIGTAKAAVNSFDDLMIVWLDAHADMNTDATSPTGNVHGTVLSAIFGQGDPALRAGLNRCIDPRDILLLGARSIDPGEREFIDSLGINHISSREIMDSVPEAIIGRVENLLRIRATRNIHLSIDIDVLDPRIAPATGVPETDGIDVRSASALIRAIMDTGLVRAIDFVEYNPLLDTDGRTLACCRALLEAI